MRSTSRTELSTWDTCKSPALTHDLGILDQAYLIGTNFILLSRLWHGFVTFGWAIAFPEEEDDETSEPLTPALITASLTNDLYSFEKEREDTKVQNAILVIMREHSYSAEKAREKHEGAKQVSLTLGGPVKKEHLWLYQPSGESGVRMALSATGN